MKIINRAQNINHVKIIKIHFSLKIRLQSIFMIYSKLTICIHIPNIKRVYDNNLHEGKRLKDIHVYLLVLNKNYIYMKQNMHKDRQNNCK